MLEEIEFEVIVKPSADELAAFYERQGYKATESREKLQRMLENTYCCVAARRDGTLIGWARGVTDGLRGRIAECKLDPAFQGPACITRRAGRIEHDAEGIAREMARRVIDALRDYGVEEIDILAFGTEVDFCKELGFQTMRGVVPMELPATECVLVDAAISAGAAG